jgi:hypothetical protein
MRKMKTKVKCIDSKTKEDQLTVGEIYIVEVEFSSFYMIIDDQGLLKKFSKNLFINEVK